MAYDEVLHGRAELAVITTAPLTAEPVLAVKVWDDPLDFVVAPEHPLASKVDITTADVAGHPAVFPGGNTFTHHIAQRLFEREGLTPNITMSTNYMETIKMMVSIGITERAATSHAGRTGGQPALAGCPADTTARLHPAQGTHLSNAARAFMALLDAERD